MASMKIRVDENETENVGKAKKAGATDNTRRAALGDLQNRVFNRNVAGKDPAQKDVKKDIQSENNRVENRWRKVLAANQKLSENNILITSKGGVAGANAARKIATRSNSVRQGSTNTNTTHGVQRDASDLVGGNKVKTLTTKVVENPINRVEFITKTKIKEEKNFVVQPAVEPTLRREDSNLSIKSLNKLKAALSRDGHSKKAADLFNKKAALAVAKTTSAAVAKPGVAAAAKTAVAAAAKTAAPRVKSGENVVIKKDSARPVPVTIKQEDSSELKIVSVQTHSAILLEGVEDIDAGDADNLVLVSEYANDIYNYLYNLEVIHSIRPNHLDEQKEIYPKMRAVLIDWINEVHLQFHLVAETFQMAVAIIDRYLQKMKSVQRSMLQLVGVTALFIAAKYEELYPPALEDFVYITDDSYTAKQILQTEIKMLKQLDFNLSRPVPLHFLRRFSKAANAEDSHHAMSKYFVELALIEYDLAHYKPSEIAAASLFLSLHLLNGNSSCDTGFDNTHWTKTLEWYSRYSPEHIRPIAKQIAEIAHNAPTAKLKAVYQKYQSSSLLKISLKPELSSVLMKSIINKE